MKKIAIMVLGLAVMLFFQCYTVSASQKDEVTLSVLSAPFGTSVYVLSSALQDIARKSHPWLRLSHAESPGFVFNMNKLIKEPEVRDSMIVGMDPALSYLAQQGSPPFDKKSDGVRLLASYALNVRWLGTLNPNIKSISDLAGKTVGLGRRPQINYAFIPEAILREGWGIDDKVGLQYLGTEPAIKALLDGIVDAAIIGAFFDISGERYQYGPPEIELMASGRKVYHLPWGEEAVEKTIESGLPFNHFTVPAGSVEYLEEDLPVFSNTLSWCAAPELPDEYAYEFVKFLYENVEKLVEYHALGSLVSPELFLQGWDRNQIHPGALKAYKELGLIN